MAAAEEEIDFAASLCRHPEGTLVALHRTLEDGEIKEVYRTLRARDPAAPGADRLHVGAKAFIGKSASSEYVADSLRALLEGRVPLPSGVLEAEPQLRHPDFVIARKQGHVWRITEKIFDYQGRFRTAYAL